MALSVILLPMVPLNVQECLLPMILFAGVVMVCALPLVSTMKMVVPSPPFWDCGRKPVRSSSWRLRPPCADP